MTVKTYKGMLNVRLGMWLMQRRGYRVVGNVAATKRLFRKPLFTVTYDR